jgi:hypothetical protein
MNDFFCMKKIIILLIIPFLISCSERIVPYENLVIRNDPEYGIVIFEINSNTPFSGKTRLFHDNGQLMVEHRVRNGITQTGSSVFHDNGQLFYIQSLDERGSFSGEMTYYDEWGRVTSIGNFENGIPFGPYTGFHSSGTVNDERRYLRIGTEFYSIQNNYGTTKCFFHDSQSLGEELLDHYGELVWMINDPRKEIYSTMNDITDCPGDFELEGTYRVN